MDERSRRVEARFERPLIVAALLTIPATIIQESPVSRPWPQVAEALDYVIWAVFLLEVVVMLGIVPSRRTWLRQHLLDVAIVIVTPPFLATVLQPVRLLRLLRLVRLMRLAPLLRHLTSAEGLRAVGAIVLLTAVGGGAAFASSEHISIGDGIYWAVETMTTVGYGDIVPHNTSGKLIAILVMIIGIGSATLLIGAVAQRFADTGPGGSPLADEDATIAERLRDITAAVGELQTLLENRRREEQRVLEERRGGSAG